MLLPHKPKDKKGLVILILLVTVPAFLGAYLAQSFLQNRGLNYQPGKSQVAETNSHEQ